MDLISELTGVPMRDFHAESRLLHDLGIAGDDAVELFLAFSREFHVDIREFPFEVYFPGEARIGFLWLRQVLARLFSVHGNDQTFQAYPPITVMDLTRMAELGHWADGK